MADNEKTMEPLAVAEAAEQLTDDNPENVPTNVWITLGLFAAFVIGFGTCAVKYLF